MALWTLNDTTTDLWLDSNDDTTRTVVTGLSNWTDKKGNGLAVVQAATGSQPAVIESTLNGLDVIRFNGSSHFLSGGDILDTGTGSFALFVLGKISSFPADVAAFVAKALYGAITGGRYSIYQTPTTVASLIDLSNDGSVNKNASYNFSDTGYHLFCEVVDRAAGTVKLIIDGVTVASQTFTPSSFNQNNTSRLLIGAYPNATDTGQQGYLNGDICEISLIKSLPSSDLIKKIEGYSLWRAGLQSQLPSGHPYASAAPLTTVLSLIEQPYGDATKYINTCQQFFSLRLQAALIQYYGDTPQLRAKIDQYWGSYAVLRRLCSMPYGDARQLRQVLEMGWTENAGLRAIMEQRYSISGGQYRALCEEVYSHNEHDILRQSLDQIFIMSPGDAIVQRPVVSVSITDGIDLDPYHINIEISEGEYAIKGEIHIADESQYLSCKHIETEVTVSVDDTDYILIVEAPRRSRPEVGGEQYYVTLASRTILLDAPYATPLTREFSGAMASAIVAEMAAIESISIVWQMIDWYIPSATLYANAETPLTVIRKVVSAAGGILQTSPAGVLICRTEYPVTTKDWATATPGFYLTDMDNYYSIESTPQIRDDYNRFSVSDQNSSAANDPIESEDIDTNTKRVMIFQIPWDDSQPQKLLTSGGAWVGIVKNGVVEEEITELIEIIAGEGNTSKPIYLTKWATGESCAPTHSYKQAVLGAITTAEDGHLSTEVAGNSLVEITYTTRYYESIVTDSLIEEVQFYSDLDEAAA